MAGCLDLAAGQPVKVGSNATTARLLVSFHNLVRQQCSSLSTLADGGKSMEFVKKETSLQCGQILRHLVSRGEGKTGLNGVPGEASCGYSEEAHGSSLLPCTPAMVW